MVESRKYRVFIVEDSQAILTVLRSSLEFSGQIEVIGHADSSDAAWLDVNLALADAVIIDLALRRGSGFDLLERMRGDPRFALVRKIVLTNYGATVFRKRALELGAHHFFDKSLEFERVSEMLESLAAGDDPFGSAA